jgi:HEAT repeat protein
MGFGGFLQSAENSSLKRNFRVSSQIVLFLTLFLFILACSESETEKANRILQKIRKSGSYISESDRRELAGIKESGGIEALIAALNDRELAVRQATVIVLGDLKDPRTVEPLIASLRDRDSKVRRIAAYALGEKKDPRAVDALLAALNDSDPDARRAAAQALGEIKYPLAVEALIATLKDRDPEVKSAAARALGKIKDPRAIDALTAALKDQFPVSSDAASGLEEIKGPLSLERLLAELKDRDPHVRRHAAFRLSQIKDPLAVEALIATLKDRDPEVKSAAARALEEIKDPRAMEALIATLKDQDPGVRSAAAGALRKIKDHRAEQALITLLYGDPGARRPYPSAVIVSFSDGSNLTLHLWSFKYRFGDSDERKTGIFGYKPKFDYSKDIHLENQVIKGELISGIKYHYRENIKNDTGPFFEGVTITLNNGNKIKLKSLNISDSFLSKKKFVFAQYLFLKGRAAGQEKILEQLDKQRHFAPYGDIEFVLNFSAYGSINPKQRIDEIRFE